MYVCIYICIDFFEEYVQAERAVRINLERRRNNKCQEDIN